jgi:hypothetical protein
VIPQVPTVHVHAVRPLPNYGLVMPKDCFQILSRLTFWRVIKKTLPFSFTSLRE